MMAWIIFGIALWLVLWLWEECKPRWLRDREMRRVDAQIDADLRWAGLIPPKEISKK